MQWILNREYALEVKRNKKNLVFINYSLKGLWK